MVSIRKGPIIVHNLLVRMQVICRLNVLWQRYLTKLNALGILAFLVRIRIIAPIGTTVTTTLTILFVSCIRPKNLCGRLFYRTPSFKQRVFNALSVLKQLLFKLGDKVGELNLVSTHKFAIVV